MSDVSQHVYDMITLITYSLKDKHDSATLNHLNLLPTKFLFVLS